MCLRPADPKIFLDAALILSLCFRRDSKNVSPTVGCASLQRMSHLCKHLTFSGGEAAADMLLRALFAEYVHISNVVFSADRS